MQVFRFTEISAPLQRSFVSFQRDKCAVLTSYITRLNEIKRFFSEISKKSRFLRRIIGAGESKPIKASAT